MSPSASAAAWFPLSPAQRSRWFMYRLDPASQGRHNNGFSARVRGPLASGALARALTQLVARHPMLRTCVRERDGEPAQCVREQAPVSVDEVRVAPHEAANLAGRVQADFARPFDLAGPAPVRATLYRVGAHELVLAVVFDHIAVDGWSYWQLLDELGELLAEPAAAPGTPAACDYRDYVASQRAWLAGPKGEAQWRYWQEQLGGPLPLLQLPTDRARASTASQQRQRSVSIMLAPALTAQLHALSRMGSATLFATLLAGYYALLQRHTGQDDIVVGTPLPGRTDPAWDRVVGDFVNPVALRARLRQGATGLALLQEVRRSALRGMANQDYPFALLVERLQPGRQGQEHPLFQTTFTFQKARQGRELAHLFDPAFDADVAWGGVALASFAAHQTGAGAPMALALEAIELGQGVRCDFKYDPDLYDEDTVRRMAGHYRRLLQGMAAAPEQAVDTLELLGDDERALVLGGFHGAREAFPDAGMVHRRFERHAATAPARGALVWEGETLAYGELNRRANRVAHRLLALGVRPDDRVALYAGRGPEMVVAMLGILKAGAAYVPMDPAYPAERIAYVLRDCAPVAVLTQAALASQLPGTSTPVLLFEEIGAQPEHDPVVDGLAPSHLAYIIYTSGSTGQPKGVMIEHRNVARLLAGTQAWFGFGPADVWSLFHSFAFDFSVWELWAPLASGGKVVLVSALCARAPDDFYALLCREGVTVLNQTPSAFRQLSAAQARSDARHSLRCIVFGGEALELHTLAPWVARNDPSVTRLVNMYGITETTVHVTYRELGRADIDAGSGSVIGVPLPDLAIRILDPRMAPVPVGVTGEMYVGGAGLARGYLNRPELTAERFIRDPLSSDPDARLYKTGDLARWRADGDIDYLGRNDFQVKIRGFRIELGEIEARLAGCAGVREAVVLARSDGQVDTRLVGYVVGDEGASLSVAALREDLAAALPAHMVPGAIVQLAAFPLTPNGKLDRTALPAPDLGAVAVNAYAAPRGDTETAMAAIWQELLGLARVGRHDNFFEIGGHSLLATRLLSRIGQALGADIPLRALFEQPTLEQVARLAAAARGSALPPIVPVARTGASPISLAQQRLWFLDQFDPAAGAAYAMPAAWRLHGPLDKAALRAALDTIVARHEVLRTHFVQDGGVPVQVVAPARPFELAEHDLRILAPAQRQEAADAVCEAELARRFELARGPLIRGALIALADDLHVLLLAQHHIVSDGWSVRLLFGELAALYGAYRDGRPDPLAPLALQYGDFAQWQHTMLGADIMQRQAAYWQAQLAGAPALLALPTDRPRPARQDHAGGHCTAVLAAPQVQALRALARRQGVTLFMVLAAGWAALLARLGGQDEVVIGTPSANRRHVELEALIGFFVNTLPLRVGLMGDPTVAQLLAQVKATLLAAQAHQDLPFEQLVEVVNPPRSLGHSPIFQTMLAMDNTPGTGEAALAGLALERLPLGNHLTQFDLSLALREIDGELHIGLDYARALFEPGTALRLLQRWQFMLAAMAQGDDRSVARLPLLDADELATLARFNDTAMPWPRDTLLHHAFEVQAAAHPERTALGWRSEKLRYGDLNRRGNRIAHRLLALGVRPDDRVAVCTERTPDMVAALLGILKAGAAYVPLDPAYPAERLAYMLADCAPAAVLCERATAARVPAGAAPLVVLDADPLLADQPVHDPRPHGVQPSHLAYVIYTSGSTGQPKGVMIEHRNAVAFIAWAQASFTPDQLELTLCATSINFDLAVYELFLPLSSGRPLALVQNVLCGDDELSEVSLINTVPSALDALLKAGRVPESSKLVNLAGEPLKRHLVEQLFAETAVQSVGNLYGPSETTTYSTFVLMARADGFAPHIGRPIGNTQVHILDAHRMPVPVGVTGELYIGGAGVARGYLHRPELTAERFIADPFSPDPQARLYRTGDLGRWRADGNIEYLGRNDFQVKIRGFRIELGEIEAALAACDGVRTAVALVRGDAQDEPRLVAYAVAQPGCNLDAVQLRTALAAQLPAHMVPAALVLLDALPLTPNGKLDRAALPAPELATPGADHVAPHAGLETTLAGIWQDLLGVERVGRHDNFFEIGGHSLLAVQLVARLQRAQQVRLGLADVFAQPVLAALAAHIGAAAPGTAPAALAAIPALGESEDYPLSHAQTRLWMAQQLDPRSAAYGIAVVLPLPAQVDRAAMAGAIDVLVARHEALRTVFALRDGEPVQRILARLSVPVEESFAADDAALARLVASNARTVFDLERGPLLAARLVRTGAGRTLLLWNMHHIVSDGVSLAILQREIVALLADGGAVLAPLPVRYVDFAAWQNAMPGDGAAASRAYWLAQLGGELPVVDLPYDYPAAARRGAAGAACRLRLAPGETQALGALAARHDATLFMALLAGFALVLAKMTGQDDVIVGTPVAGRAHPDTQQIVGCFINTVMLRQRVDAAATVATLLRAVRTGTLAALAHQDYPFEKLVEELAVVRDIDRFPVSPVFLNLLPVGGGSGVPDDAAPHRALEQDVKFDLNLYVAQEDGGLWLDCHYRTACFKAETVEYILREYLRLLAAMAQDDARRCSGFDLFALPARPLRLPALLERHPFTRFGDSEIDQSIPARFAHQVALHGERVAVRTPRITLTYRALDAASDAVGRLLAAHGGAGNERVALLFEHDAPMIVGLLGALKAGMTYVPLDPGYPEARLAYMLEDSGARVLVTNGDNLALARRLAGTRLVVDVDAPDGASAALPDTIDPDTVAYILYTSGSTGQPKGVLQTHRNALYFCMSYTNNLHIAAADRLLLLASYSFDAAVMDIFGALMNGAALYPVDPKQTARHDLLAWMAAQAISIYHSTPTLYRHLFGAPGARADAAVRLVVLGGELVTLDDVASFKRAFGAHSVFINGYGPTESTLALQNFITHAVDAADTGISAGHPIDGTSIALGAPGTAPHAFQRGEIVIQSKHVALGYWASEAQTARAFGAGPAPGRHYRTGDIGRLGRDGSLVVNGRIDNQVKMRGYRIELGEIEARLQACAGVRQAVVVARTDPGSEPRLVAYLIAPAGGAPSTRQWRAQLLADLPEYMVPSAYVVLERFPQTPSGKLDRRSLPAPGAQVATDEHVAPLGATETALAAMWQELLGVEAVGRHAHFFELGGHSLLAIRMAARIRERFEVEVTLREVFAHPTPERLAALIGRSGARPLAAIPPADRSRALPLSFSQQRLWFLDQLDVAAGAAYHMSAGLRLRGVLDGAALGRALDVIVDRHESLRTTLAMGDEHPCQQVGAPGAGCPLVRRDLREIPAEARDAVLHAHIGADLAAPMDLQRGPLLRGSLLRTGDAQHVLFVTMHHIVSDGWSLDIFARELSALYAAFSEGRPDPLPPLPLQYPDYAAWQRARLQGALLERLTAFWRAQLDGAPSLITLPLDRPRGARQRHEGGQYDFVLPAPLAARLKALGRRHGVTLFMILLAGWATLLGRLSGQDDVVVGTPVANRDHAEVQGLIGFFVNTLALRVQSSGNDTVEALLAALRESTLAAYAHQELPFEQVVHALNPLRTMAHSPVFQVMLAMNPASGAALSLPGIEHDALVPERLTTHYDLSLAVTDGEGALGASIAYASALFDVLTVARVAQQLCAVLDAMAQDDGRSIGALLDDCVISDAAPELEEIIW